MPQGVPGAMDAGSSPSPPATCRGRGSLSSCSSPVELLRARALPLKPLNNSPFFPFLGTGTGTEALRGSGNAGGRAQAFSAGEAQGKEGCVQCPQHSPFSAALP